MEPIISETKVPLLPPWYLIYSFHTEDMIRDAGKKEKPPPRPPKPKHLKSPGPGKVFYYSTLVVVLMCFT